MARTHYVRGFHATSKQNAAAIDREGFKPSNNSYDWLGPGVYFYQDTFDFTRNWGEAERKEGSYPDLVVFGADIIFENFIDLVDYGWAELLREIHGDLSLEGSEDFEQAKRKQKPFVAGQTQVLPHPLDWLVIRHTVTILKEQGTKIKGVRAVFLEGEPIYDNSHLLDRTHIQLAVLEPDSIKEYWMVT